MAPRSLFAALSPPLCVACRMPASRERPLCDRCVFELNSEQPVWGDPPPGLDRCVAAFRHEGTARSLLHAFKFGRIPSLAGLLAGYMAENISRDGDGLTVVTVPAARVRRMWRGYDPAALLAVEIAAGCDGCRLETGAIVRSGFGRQRGGDREQRVGSPPVIRAGPAAAGRVRGPVLLVDDVITTGATITACAAVLRRRGADPLTALVCTRRV
jgi:predicted amidophosphoribosyltransferase